MTALEAVAEMDAGPIWASVDFPMREAAKGSVYRNEVTEAAVQALLATLGRIADPSFRPAPLDSAATGVRGRLRPLMRQADRAIDWSRDDSASVLAKIHAADGVPGVLDEVRGVPVYLNDATPGGRVARRAAGRGDRATRRRDSPRNGRRRRLDRSPQAQERRRADPQASRDDGARRAPRGRAGSAGVAVGRNARANVSRAALRGSGRGGVRPLRVLQRGDEHAAMRASGRGDPVREGAPDARDRAAGRRRLLVERHPPQRHRGVAHARRRVLGEHQCDRRRRTRDPRLATVI